NKPASHLPAIETQRETLPGVCRCNAYGQRGFYGHQKGYGRSVLSCLDQLRSFFDEHVLFRKQADQRKSLCQWLQEGAQPQRALLLSEYPVCHVHGAANERGTGCHEETTGLFC